MVFVVLIEKSLIFCGGGQVEKRDRVLSFNSYFINVPCCFYQGSYARLTSLVAKNPPHLLKCLQPFLYMTF